MIKYKNIITECLITVALISLMIVMFIYIYKVNDFYSPSSYEGDSLYFLQTINNVLQFNDPFFNWFGTPFPSELYLFPGVTLPWIYIIRAIAYWSSDIFFIANIFALISCVLNGASFYTVTRLLGIRRLLASLGALTFCFLPFGVLRSLAHQSIMPMFAIPLGSYLALLIFYFPKKIFFTSKKIEKKIIFNMMFLIIFCALIGVSGHYWAGFSCIFIITASLITSLSTNGLRPIITGIGLCATITIFFLLSQLPVIYAGWQTASPIPASPRGPIDQSVYGLRVMDLLIPIDYNYPVALKGFINFYNAVRMPSMVEGRDDFIGPLAVIGFCVIVFLIFNSFNGIFNKRSRSYMKLFRRRACFGAAILCIFGVLFSVTNSFGNVFHLVISTVLRAQNRSAMFIAFFCLFVVLVMLESYYRKQHSIFTKRITSAILIVFVLFSIHVQSGFISFEARANILTTIVKKDHNFFSKFNTLLGGGRQILQLPIMVFPGSPPIVNLSSFDHFRGSLHAAGNRWSYGAVEGRPAYVWQDHLASLPTKEMLARARASGFDVILLERRGYMDKGDKIVHELIDMLGVKALIIDEDDRVVFNLCRHYGDKQLPVLPEMRNRGFSILESAPNHLTFRWNDTSDGHAKFALENYDLIARAVTIEGLIGTGYDEKFSLFIRGPGINFTKAMINGDKFSIDLIITPGINIYEIWTSARQLLAPLDTRKLFFTLWDLKVFDHNYEALVDRYRSIGNACFENPL